GRWVVGHDGRGHTLIPNGVVVYEGAEVVFVGRAFEGAVDSVIDASDKLVAPGFIDTHVHSGHRASHRLISDAGRPLYFGQPFLEISVPKEGRVVSGDPRYLKPGDAAVAAALELNATFTVAELLRNGVTTFVEFGSGIGVQRALLREVDRLGTRAYLGPGYDCGRWVGDQEGRLKRIFDPEGGLRGLEEAVAFIREHDGACGGRVRGILVPREVETATVELLAQTLAYADELGVPMATHAAYSVLEFHDVVREHQKTPIELLAGIGMLRPTLNIGHGNFIADDPNLNYSGAQDLALMGHAGCSISHCPINIARRGRTLRDWHGYRKAGVNIAIGSDTYPRDMVMNMRTASLMGKIVGHDYFKAPAGEVFEAATLGGARSLGRDDLGRLAPGTRADIVVIDMAGRNSLRFGPIRDPIKSLVECGIGDDIDTVIIDGVTRMVGGVIPGIDMAALAAEAQSAGEAIWASLPDWDPRGRDAGEASPWSFPLADR
ncbi:chlorohydrolase family protein, partial [uncultured Methylobacterium sp.]|uniref:chlorohydrolase family protein n=1 Tax=uncultured Methylobacterium sp. TaxID=157278 RepID=UPI0035CC664B